MITQLVSVRLEVRSLQAQGNLNINSAGQSIVFDDGVHWHYTLIGPWVNKNTQYEVEFGVVGEEGEVTDGFRISVDHHQQSVKVSPKGIGQLRCFISVSNGTLIVSSESAPYRDAFDCFEKGQFTDTRQSHTLDWGNFFGSGAQLRHGEELVWRNGTIQSYVAQGFYPARQSGLDRVTSREQASRVFRESLIEATQRALIGRDKVALHMSGGIDSAAVAAAATILPEQDRPQLKIFSWQLDNKTADESRFIKESALKLGVEFELVRPRSEFSAYDPDTLEAMVEPLDSMYNPFRFLVGTVLERSVQQGFHYALNGNAGDNVISLPSHFAMVEAWRDKQFGEFYRIIKRLIDVLGVSNLSKVQAFRQWVRYVRGKSLIDFPIGNAGDYQRELNALKELVINWPATLDKTDPQHASYWKLACGDGLFPVASALTYSARIGCFAHTPYFDYQFVLRIKDIPSYYLTHPYEFKRLPRAAFVGILPDSITQRPYRRGNLNPIMDQGYAANRIGLREFLMDKRSQLPPWQWWDKLDVLLKDESKMPLRGDALFFLNKAIAKIINTHRMIEEK